MVITDTASFRAALETDPDQAEGWLATVQANPGKFPQYDDRWLDHRQRELFQVRCKAKDWPAAKRIVEATKDPHSKEGRTKRLEELSSKLYEEL
ncbi:MAG: hypothetical protein A2677_01315 [Candidatus Komeilibacteria bacterium RIFCSPHIGHO2_01_FULL_52_14]|uniref:Uncharacterized protein n=1 Tax=Candidatus Komeilibacteria bacterium RIFCSPHIGHO2_01_FULL_52_14 TaxID=1798549 RepID=A0A1G2BJU4_9BACT|nr:MAG: hypothetical protein A2677_01315 [Candidatus Komeilibacteria bacterium RIFCSPHIGHO2_01_FULL_52_14]